jgi:threonine synthase
VSTPYLYDRSGRRYPIGDTRWRGEDGSPLMVSPMAGLTPEQIVSSERSLWRYQAALPVDPARRVSLGEGWTPLLPIDWRGHRVHVKPEWFNPTSSFKDRGVSVMISHLAAQGVGHVLEDSSGNGGSSVAAYSAAAGIKSTIIVPEATSPAKILQARAFGAEVDLVGGTRDQVSDEAIRRSAQIPYASHNWHPMFLQGTKTIAYEMWEQLGFRAPDNVVLVAGAGSNILGCDLAFSELLAAEQIDRLPRLLVAQPEHWATIADTVNGVDPAGRGPRRPTMAQGASIAHPVRLAETVAAVRRSGGAALAVDEERIAAAVRGLTARGLYAEPTSAVAAAALDHYLGDGTIAAGETTVLVLTGSGLKAADLMAGVFAGAVR